MIKIEAVQKTIEDRWREGADLADRSEDTYGKRVIQKLAKKRKRSPESLHFEKRLAERWPIELVQAADKAEVPWHGVMLLLSYSPAPAERERAEKNKTLGKALAIREEQVKQFIRSYALGELQGVEFLNAIMRWREEHIDLWSEGKQRRRLRDHTVKIQQHANELMRLVDEQEERIRPTKANAEQPCAAHNQIVEAQHLLQKAVALLTA